MLPDLFNFAMQEQPEDNLMVAIPQEWYNVHLMYGLEGNKTNYNHRRIVLERLVNKATESESQIETSAQLLLSYVEAFVCRLSFPPAPLFNVGFPTFQAQH